MPALSLTRAIAYHDRMLSVMIECGPGTTGLGQSLAPLVAGAVEGLVREVVVVDGGMTPGEARIADHAGCGIVPAGELRRAVAAARGEWLLLLEPGARLPPGWTEAVAAHVESAEAGRQAPEAARFSRARTRGWRAFWPRPTALSQGLLLRKAQAVGRARQTASLEAMARGLATRRLSATMTPPAR